MNRRASALVLAASLWFAFGGAEAWAESLIERMEAGEMMLAPRPEIDQVEMEFQALWASVVRAERRFAALRGRYSDYKAAESMGGYDIRERVLRVMAVSHVHTPYCVHYYESEYAALSPPSEVTSREVEDLNMRLRYLLESIRAMEGAVSRAEMRETENGSVAD